MSILAEPRRRQKISVDPQNLQWKNDEDTFSKKLMKKMGWNSGDGLGRNRQGNANHVKLNANYSGKGLGADKVASYDSTWIGHHDDFADLLTALNQNKESISKNEDSATDKNLQKMSMELKSKSIRRRIHYQKFTRAKDSANYTANDKSSILGLGLKRTKPEEEKEDSDDNKDGDFSSDTKHTVSTLSVTDYFAKKMAALKANAQVKSEVEDTSYEMNGEVVIKEEMYVKEEVEEYDEEETERLRKERKAAKKLAKLARRQAEEIEAREIKEEPLDEDEVVEKPKKKKKKTQEPSEEDDEEVVSSEKKKDRKREREVENDEAEVESTEKKSKKQKKAKKSVDE